MTTESPQPNVAQQRDSEPPIQPAPQVEADGESHSEPLIRIADLNAWYGDFQAIHSLSLDIPRHQVTAFIGPSGCGKSTLLKWINRMNDIVPSAHARGTLQMGDLDILSSTLR